MALKSFAKLLRDAKRGDSFWAESAKNDFALAVHQAMKKAGMSQSELARRMDCKPAYISSALRGDENFSIEQMNRIARAVGGKLLLHIVSAESVDKWSGLIRDDFGWVDDHDAGAFKLEGFAGLPAQEFSESNTGTPPCQTALEQYCDAAA